MRSITNSMINRVPPAFLISSRGFFLSATILAGVVFNLPAWSQHQNSFTGEIRGPAKITFKREDLLVHPVPRTEDPSRMCGGKGDSYLAVYKKDGRSLYYLATNHDNPQQNKKFIEFVLGGRGTKIKKVLIAGVPAQLGERVDMGTFLGPSQGNESLVAAEIAESLGLPVQGWEPSKKQLWEGLKQSRNGKVSIDEFRLFLIYRVMSRLTGDDTLAGEWKGYKLRTNSILKLQDIIDLESRTLAWELASQGEDKATLEGLQVKWNFDNEFQEVFYKFQKEVFNQSMPVTPLNPNKSSIYVNAIAPSGFVKAEGSTPKWSNKFSDEVDVVRESVLLGSLERDLNNRDRDSVLLVAGMSHHAIESKALRNALGDPQIFCLDSDSIKQK
jgi:hypothetical protein